MWKATCSVSAKKFVGFASSVSGSDRPAPAPAPPGTSLVESRRSMPSNIWSGVSGKIWMPSSHAGKAPDSMASYEVAAVEVGVDPADQLGLLPREGVHAEPRLPVELDERRPTVGVDAAGRCGRRTPPSSDRSAGCRGPTCSRCVWCCASVCSETKSQKVSWALCACGISRSGCGLPAWMTSGNLMPSWMKKTGMLLPTRSQLPSLGVELRRKAAGVAHRVGRPAGPEHGREAHERAASPHPCRGRLHG